MLANKIIVRISNASDVQYTRVILSAINTASRDGNSSILHRSSKLISKKLKQGHAVIAHTVSGQWVGFCYIQSWTYGKYISNCGLVVDPVFRNLGVASKIKQKIVQLAKEVSPDSVLFGLTTSLAVMRINSNLGYKPVPYSQITKDDEFWNACRACPDHKVLLNGERKTCLCTAMMYQL